MSKAFAKQTDKDHSRFTGVPKNYKPDYKKAIMGAMMRLTIQDRLSGNIKYGDYYER